MSGGVGTDLRIGRLSATLPPMLDRGRIDLLLRRIAGAGLEDALADAGLPGGEWCLRRLDVPVRVDAGASDERITAVWSAALAAAVRRALAGGEDVVRYASPRAAAVDLVSSVALGRWRRAWAWRQIGLLEASGHVTPAAAIVGALTRSGDDALGVLVVAAEAAGVAALHRALGPDSWPAAVAAVTGVRITTADVEAIRSRALAADGRVRPPTGAYGPERSSDGRLGDERLGDERLGDERLGDERLGDERLGDERFYAEFARRAADLLRRSRFAVAVTASQVRPDSRTAAAWAAIVALEADPVVFRRPERDGLVAAIASVLFEGPEPASHPAAGDQARTSPAKPPAAEAGPDWPAAAPSGRTAPEQANEAPAAPGPGDRIAREPTSPDPTGPDATSAAPTGPEPIALEPTDPEPAAPEPAPLISARSRPGRAGVGSGEPERTVLVLPDGRLGVPTAWAGLPFLLNTAASAGLPGAAIRPTLTGRSVRWVLHALATRMVPADPADPAVLALCGLTPQDQPPSAIGEPPTARERRALARIARRWITATADLLASAPSDPAAMVVELARRPGVVVADPGWIGIHLPLADVRLDVRRAGLDLDPGWVPWLRTVVRFVYRGGDDG